MSLCLNSKQGGEIKKYRIRTKINKTSYLTFASHRNCVCVCLCPCVLVYMASFVAILLYFLADTFMQATWLIRPVFPNLFYLVYPLSLFVIP